MDHNLRAHLSASGREEERKRREWGQWRERWESVRCGRRRWLLTPPSSEPILDAPLAALEVEL